MKKMKTAKLFSAILSALIVVTIFGINQVSATSTTVRNSGTDIDSSPYVKFNLSLLDDNGIVHYAGKYNDPNATGTDMIINTPYTATFTLNYYGIPLIVETTVTLLSNVPEGKTCRVYIDKDNLLQVGWTAPVRVQWQTKVYDANDSSKSYLKYFLFGFLDPDESDYNFTSEGRTVYYTDKPGTIHSSYRAIDYYYFTVDEGARDGFNRVGTGVETFDDAIFAVSTYENEETFMFVSNSPVDGALQIPHLYSNTYAVRYDANRKEGAGDAPAGTDNVDVTDQILLSFDTTYQVKNNTFTTEGYNFRGWSMDPGIQPVTHNGGENYENLYFTTESGKPDTTRAKTFYAQWTPAAYDVMYDANRETGANNSPAGDDNVDVINQTDLTFGETYNVRINTYTTKGYKFRGWSNTSGVQTETHYGGEPFTDLYNTITVGDETIPDRSNPVTFYAQWDPINYNVLYDANREVGASGSPAGDDNVDVENQLNNLYDTKYNIRNNTFTTVGHTFKGWNTEKDGSGTPYLESAEYSNLTTVDGGTVTLYAQWEPYKYNVLYDANREIGAGGSPAGDDNVDVENQLNNLYGHPYNIRNNTFTTVGYTFTGWNTEKDGSGTSYAQGEEYKNLTAVDGGTVTLYAQWRPWNYYINYEPNGGQGSMGPQSFTYFDDKMDSLSNTFTRDGYSFTGFVYEYKGTKYALNGIDDFKERLLSLGPESSITLIAQWQKNKESAAASGEGDDDDVITVYYRIPVTGIK